MTQRSDDVTDQYGSDEGRAEMTLIETRMIVASAPTDATSVGVAQPARSVDELVEEAAETIIARLIRYDGHLNETAPPPHQLTIKLNH